MVLDIFYVLPVDLHDEAVTSKKIENLGISTQSTYAYLEYGFQEVPNFRFFRPAARISSDRPYSY